jgi:succinoglycan biosynthesis transport protein ExoP
VSDHVTTLRDEQIEPEPPQLREYLAVLRLRKWSIMLVTALVVASTLAFSFLQTPLYESETKVLVKPVSVSPGVAPPALPNLETERGLVSSVPVAQKVAEELGLGGDPSVLLDDLDVEVVTGSEFLIVNYRHPDPLEARGRSQAFAESYLEFRREQALAEGAAATQTVERQLRELNREFAELEEQIAETRDPSELATLEAQQSTLIGRIAVLEQQLSELLVPENLRVGQVVEPAEVPASPATPNYLVNVPLALFVGLALGVGLAFLRERLDDRLRGRGDLEGRAGASVLAVVPKVTGWRKRKEARLVTAEEPRSAASEAYRTLRTSLLFTASQNGIRTVLVTSPQIEEGKTTTVANLGVALGQAGKRVVIVDADLRKPRLHRFFNAQNATGLTNLIAGETDPAHAVLQSGVPHLRLLPSGPVPGNPAELLSSDAMGTMLQQMGEVADFVIIDSAPILVAADASILATYADAVLLVADADRATRGSVAHARIQLDQVNANVVGAVLNNFDLSRARAYPYYYQYYYVYRSEQPDGSRRSRRAEKAEPETGDQRRMWSG